MQQYPAAPHAQQQRLQHRSLLQTTTTTNSMCAADNVIAYFYKSSLHGSTENLQKSLQLLYDNYLSLPGNDVGGPLVIVFHTGDLQPQHVEVPFDIQLINVHDRFGRLPQAVVNDDPTHWLQFPPDNNDRRRQQHLDARHESQFWSIQIWNYISECDVPPSYLWHLHPNTFLYSPISYNIFDFMKNNNYQYSFRLCQSQTMVPTVWEEFLQDDSNNGQNNRQVFEGCLLDAQSFFVASTSFFRTLRPVQTWLKFLQAGGYLYRQNLSLSLIHSLAVQAYATAPSRVHRFLDFTIHVAGNSIEEDDDDCASHPIRGFQGGYQDVDGQAHIEEWLYYYTNNNENEKKKKQYCSNNKTPQLAHLIHEQLTPQLTHLPPYVAETIQLPTLVVVDSSSSSSSI